MKKMINSISVLSLVVLFLTGCQGDDYTALDSQQVSLLQQTENQVPNDEIERLLMSLELEVGLGNLKEAISIYERLNSIIETTQVSSGQQARLNTLHNWLEDMLAHGESQRVFSGSDAVTLVINTYGVAPDGYQFVYHEIPSFVGSDGLGFYVFLRPSDDEEQNIVTTFFATDRGRVLRLN